MPPYVFGDSYGGVASNRLAYDTLNASIAQRQAQDAMEAQRMQQQQYQFNLTNQQGQDAAAQSRADSLMAGDLARANAAYQFQANQEANQAAAEEKKSEFKQSLDLAGQQEVDRVSNQNYLEGTKQTAADFNDAMQAANRGELDNPDWIGDYPTLTPDQQGRVNAVRARKSLEKNQTYAQQTGIARMLNAQLAKIKTTTPDTEAALNILYSNPQLQRSKSFDHAQWDDDTSSFVPMTSKPKGADVVMPPAPPPIPTTPNGAPAVLPPRLASIVTPGAGSAPPVTSPVTPPPPPPTTTVASAAPTYSSSQDVVKAYQTGLLTRDQAKQILKTQFNIE